MRPDNHKEINNKFWTFLLLFCLIMTLTGFVVYTNASVPNRIESQKCETNSKLIVEMNQEQEKILEHMQQLNQLIGKMDTLGEMARKGDKTAQGRFNTLRKNYDIELAEFKKSQDDSPLLQSILKTYEQIDEFISIGSVYDASTQNCQDKIKTLEKERDRFERENERNKDKYDNLQRCANRNDCPC